VTHWICRHADHHWTWTQFGDIKIRHCRRCAPAAGIDHAILWRQYPLPLQVDVEIGETTTNTDGETW
jgi:hypothetical protein